MNNILKTSLLLSAFFFLAPSVGFSKTLIERVEATVNKDSILLSDITDFRKTLELRKQLDPLFSNTKAGEKGNSATDKEVVDFLVNEKLILQQFPVADETVEKEIKSIQATNNIDRKGLINALGQQGFRYSDYFELIRPSISKRNLIDRDIRTKVHISDDDIKNYFYNNYKKKKKQNFSYRIGMMTFSTETHSSLNDARKAAEKAVQLIKAGQSFEDAAKDFSDDSNSSTGGDLGFLRESEMSPLIKKTLKDLQVGNISQPIQAGKNAFILLKLIDIRSGDEDELKAVKEQIRLRLTSNEYTRQVKLWLERQRQSAFVRYAGQPTFKKKNAKK